MDDLKVGDYVRVKDSRNDLYTKRRKDMVGIILKESMSYSWRVKFASESVKGRDMHVMEVGVFYDDELELATEDEYMVWLI